MSDFKVVNHSELDRVILYPSEVSSAIVHYTCRNGFQDWMI